ncbi:protein kinase domain-containing protein [Streptomyces sp. TP-A0874]|uniref:protein kinase domain-containing protein n=1 Tax=Streptomyces sp. TP-A0874 TaxID=549819 RepID=UPI00099F661C|nr:protein kinase [Streptomyces sp. TP-A0874]
MAQTRSGGPSEPDSNGGGMADAPEMWGNGGMVGDGRYRLTHRLGRGGMAEVFAAEDVRLGRTVAVKLLRSDLAEDPVSKARFTREAQSVAGLNHHAVVAVYDSGEDTVGANTVPYIVMELVEGRTIRDLLINADTPPPEQALIIVSGVLEALAYSHHHGIVHRDIKPANVIITHNGAIKVMDFGIARALHGAASTMTQTGMVMGTPQYLSPEQALGKTVDARSDLYATGCLLYELLALRPPFTGETPLSVVYQHVQDTPVPPSQVLDSAPPELDGLVMRSLAKEPDDRFQSAEEMRGLVQYALQMLGSRGGHTGTWDTGPAVVGTAATPPMGTTAAMPPTSHGDTSQFSVAGGMPDGGPPGGGQAGRGRLWLMAALAVVAVVVAGSLMLVFRPDNGDDTKKPPRSPATSQSEDQDTSEPSPEESTEEVDPGDSSGGGDWGWTEEPSESIDEPSEDPTEEPTDNPTDDPSTGRPGGGDPGGGGEPPTSGPPEPTDSGGEGGGDPGGSDEGGEGGS